MNIPENERIVYCNRTNKSIVRGLWGDAKIHNRQLNTYKEMQELKENPYFINNFVVYTYGRDNHNYAISLGYKSILLNNNPNPYDLLTNIYRHKLEIFKIAMQDYSQIVYMDWDCIPTKPFQNNFWEILNEKESIQCNLQWYKRRKAKWRQENQRIMTNGGFVYIRNKSIPDKLLELHDELKGNSMEPPIAKYIDNIHGEFPGIEFYYENYEPELCNLKKRSVYSKEQLENKSYPCFIHNHGGGLKRSVRKELKEKNANK